MYKVIYNDFPPECPEGTHVAIVFEHELSGVRSVVLAGFAITENAKIIQRSLYESYAQDLMSPDEEVRRSAHKSITSLTIDTERQKQLIQILKGLSNE